MLKECRSGLRKKFKDNFIRNFKRKTESRQAANLRDSKSGLRMRRGREKATSLRKQTGSVM